LFLGVGVALALGLVDALWNFALHQLRAIVVRVAVALLVGGLGGLLGGLVSEGLYELAENVLGGPKGAAFGVVGPALVVFGWTLVGLLVGVAPGAFDLAAAVARGKDPGGAGRKVRNGLLGGGVGGLLGGVLSVLLRATWEGLFKDTPSQRLWSPSATGFMALGACIGLLIGLAQVILKEAWLKVEAGFRAGRELILTKPEITIGRSEACDVGLFGDNGNERVHARLRHEGGRYVLADAGTPGGTWVNDERIAGPRPLRAGDAIRVGRYVLRFGERHPQGG
jgi:hypothetical protein